MQEDSIEFLQEDKEVTRTIYGISAIVEMEQVYLQECWDCGNKTAISPKIRCGNCHFKWILLCRRQ